VGGVIILLYMVSIPLGSEGHVAVLYLYYTKLNVFSIPDISMKLGKAYSTAEVCGFNDMERSKGHKVNVRRKKNLGFTSPLNQF
jgi:hypothetical protein